MLPPHTRSRRVHMAGGPHFVGVRVECKPQTKLKRMESTEPEKLEARHRPKIQRNPLQLGWVLHGPGPEMSPSCRVQGHPSHSPAWRNPEVRNPKSAWQNPTKQSLRQKGIPSKCRRRWFFLPPPAFCRLTQPWTQSRKPQVGKNLFGLLEILCKHQGKLTASRQNDGRHAKLCRSDSGPHSVNLKMHNDFNIETPQKKYMPQL